MLLSVVASHVGSERCLVRLHRYLGGKPWAPQGARALELVQELSKIIRCAHGA